MMKAPRLAGTFVPRDQRLPTQEENEDDESRKHRRLIAAQRKRIAALERELGQAKRDAANTTTETANADELAKLQETNFELEAALKVVEVEKDYAIQRGIAEAKAELQFKDAELQTALRRKAPQPLVAAAAAAAQRDAFHDILFEDPAALKDCSTAIADAAASPRSRVAAITAIADNGDYALAEALVNGLEDDIDGKTASDLARTVLLQKKKKKKKKNNVGTMALILALYQACDGAFDDETTRVVWTSVRNDDDNDSVLVELAAAYCVRDKATLKDVVWPVLTHAAHRARITRPESRLLLRALVDVASAVAVDEPEAARCLLAATKDILTDILNFANDAIDAYLDHRRCLDDDDDDALRPSTGGDDEISDGYVDDARAVLHLLGHVAFFADADKFVEDVYNAKDDDRATHELRALCHRVKYALEPRFASTALDRDADQLLALLGSTPPSS